MAAIVQERNDAAAGRGVVERRRGQVDLGIESAAVGDGVGAAGIPDGLVKGVVGNVGDLVDIVAGIMGMDAIARLQDRDVERSQRRRPAIVYPGDA